MPTLWRVTEADAIREPLDYDALTQLFAERGIPSECPVCNANAWAALGTLKNLYALVPLADADGARLEAGGLRVDLLALGLACGNCGFLKLLSEDILHRLREGDPDLPGTPFTERS